MQSCPPHRHILNHNTELLITSAQTGSEYRAARHTCADWTRIQICILIQSIMVWWQVCTRSRCGRSSVFWCSLRQCDGSSVFRSVCASVVIALYSDPVYMWQTQSEPALLPSWSSTKTILDHNACGLLTQWLHEARGHPQPYMLPQLHFALDGTMTGYFQYRVCTLQSRDTRN